MRRDRNRTKENLDGWREKERIGNELKTTPKFGGCELKLRPHLNDLCIDVSALFIEC